MHFFGMDFAGEAARCAATKSERFEYVGLRQGIFDSLYATNNVAEEYHPRPDPWDFDTILHADFLGSLHAGNVEFSAEQVTHILLKRRVKGTFDWLTLYQIDVGQVDDFAFERFDYLGRAKVEYEYAFVPVINNAEGELSTGSVYSDFEGILLVGRDYVYQAVANIAVTGIQRNRPGTVVSTLGRRYPVVMANGENNYETGSLSGLFSAFDLCTNTGDDFAEEEYRKAFYDFLSDGKAKVLKDGESRIWLVMMTEPPLYAPVPGLSRTMGNSQLSWTEIGSATSASDLYLHGLSDVWEEGS